MTDDMIWYKVWWCNMLCYVMILHDMILHDMIWYEIA